MDCKHRWVYIETVKGVTEGPHTNVYFSIDRFFCEHCLALFNKDRRETRRYAPEWWTAS